MHLLSGALIVLGLAILVALICHRLRIPAVVGFLLTGVLAGPHGLALVPTTAEVDHLAELGIILLLFTIGVEFSLTQLLAIRRYVLIGGAVQVILTTAAVAVLGIVWGRPWGEAVFLGWLVSLSSTAVVLKLMQERAEMDTPHGRMVLGVLIFQDIVAIPMMLAAPLLAAGPSGIGTTLGLTLVKGVGIVAAAGLAARWLVPRLLHLVARTRNREVFLLAVIGICLGVGWLTAVAGLSLALGAFLAGLIISESDYGHQALGNVIPLRDLFTSFFFVSVGMLLDVRFLATHPLVVGLAVVGVILLKGLLAGAAVWLLSGTLRATVTAGLALAQVGEFSFILARVGQANGLLADWAFPLFLAAAVASMAATPLTMALAGHAAGVLDRLPVPQFVRRRRMIDRRSEAVALEDHLVIVGYGVNGRNVAAAARRVGIPYIVVELNPDTVRREQAAGEPLVLGDASHDSVLEHVRVPAARVVVVAINDPAATRAVAAAVRRLHPAAHLIVRTRYLEEVGALAALGVSEIIPEEFETSVEIFTRVLAHYLVPRATIEEHVAAIRASGYAMFRSLSPGSAPLTVLPDIDIAAVRLDAESELAGRTLAEARLRNRYGVTVASVRRSGETLDAATADLRLQEGDVLYVIGAPDRVAVMGRACRGCRPGDAPAP
jgi:CPA2 family monovalent cation:H+ antiporter-2